MRRAALCLLLAAGLGVEAGHGQSMPVTVGETLSGKKLVLAEAIKGHTAVLVIGFSREAGDGCGVWAKALHGDAAMAGVPVYEAAMLEKAPGFVRGMIKSGMRKGLTPAQQDAFVVLTQDEKLWRSYLQVTEEKDPYVVLLGAGGNVRWHGHGAADGLEPLLRAAKR
jgi:hypothetical protein